MRIVTAQAAETIAVTALLVLMLIPLALFLFEALGNVSAGSPGEVHPCFQFAEDQALVGDCLRSPEK